MRAVKLVLFNQIVVGGAVTLVMHPVYVWRGCSFGPELPSFHWVLFEIAIFTLVEEVGFYYSHRYVSKELLKIRHWWLKNKERKLDFWVRRKEIFGRH